MVVFIGRGRDHAEARRDAENKQAMYENAPFVAEAFMQSASVLILLAAKFLYLAVSFIIRPWASLICIAGMLVTWFVAANTHQPLVTSVLPLAMCALVIVALRVASWLEERVEARFVAHLFWTVPATAKVVNTLLFAFYAVSSGGVGYFVALFVAKSSKLDVSNIQPVSIVAAILFALLSVLYRAKRHPVGMAVERATAPSVLRDTLSYGRMVSAALGPVKKSRKGDFAAVNKPWSAKDEAAELEKVRKSLSELLPSTPGTAAKG